jgi:hypothetical protein
MCLHRAAPGHTQWCCDSKRWKDNRERVRNAVLGIEPSRGVGQDIQTVVNPEDTLTGAGNINDIV